MEFMKKGALLALSGLLLVHSPVAAKGNLVENKGNTYFYSDGQMQKNWQLVDGSYKYFDKSDGQMWVNGYGVIDGKKYYFDYKGDTLKGWQKIFGQDRYFSPETGELYVNRKATINKISYSFDKQGNASKLDQVGSYYLDRAKSKYSNSADAKAGINKLSSKLEPGNYFIYKEYAGMLNLSKSQATAGAWINPNEGSQENTVIKVVDNKVLNVRSQRSVSSKKLGVLKKGDEIEGIVRGAWFEYSYRGQKGYVTKNLIKDKPIELIPDEENSQIVPEETYTAIVGKSVLTEKQMVNYLKKVYPNASEEIYGFPGIYLEEGISEGIRGDIAFAQALLETGNFKFPNTHVSISQNNFCGLGVTGSGVQGESFATPRLGIRAQIQHLKAYASKEDLRLDLVDPRYHYVERANSPYVEWLGAYENPTSKGWAYSPKYGEKILNIMENISRIDGR